MSAYRFVLLFMNRLKAKYLLAALCIMLAASFSFITPLIIRFTVDTVLGGKPADLPFGLGAVLNA